MTLPQRRRIVVLDAIQTSSRKQFEALLDPGFELVVAERLDPDHLKQLIIEADYAITGQTPVPRSLLAAAKRLRLLHKWGVGVDAIDLDAARELRIPVARLPGGNALQVAEYTIGLMIATSRGGTPNSNRDTGSRVACRMIRSCFTAALWVWWGLVQSVSVSHCS